MTKPIKIVPENATAIEARLSEANGRARTHTFTTYLELHYLAEKAEKDLEKFGVTKANRSGATYVATSGGPLPKAYGYKAIQTWVILERRSSHWYLANAGTSDLYPRQCPARELQVTQAQADEACRRLLANVTVKKPKTTALAA